MKYHSLLLKKYISLSDTPESIADKLTLKTCEIEEVDQKTITESIVIGYVSACSKHPEADKLNVCQVNCGEKGQYQILCGGLNVKEGLYVPVALPGTYFPKANMTIEKRVMRGLESNGMICSKEEVDVMEDLEEHGIWDLQADFDDISDADLGTPLVHKYSWLSRYVFDVDNKTVTNRPDLTGHFGVAVELNAMYQDSGMISYNKATELMKHISHTNILETLEHATPAKRKVIAQTSGVNTYTLLELNNISITPSTFFTRLQMIDLGSTPRNNWVDFSNLFMLLTGQPIHFFDADKVSGDIIVRNAHADEQFTDLFGTQHSLVPTDIVIADSQKVLALAGVVGGLESGITDTTKNILVEIANFDAVAVRKTGTRLGLRTDAELRFEKNINPWWSLYVLLFFLNELEYYSKDLGNFEKGGIAYSIADHVTTSRSKHITLDIDRSEQSIFGHTKEGFSATAHRILEGLGFHFSDSSTLLCPVWRSPDDLNIMEDITEEILRIYGYEQVEGIPVLGDTVYTPFSPEVQLQRNLEDTLVQCFHCDQTETYPWVSEKLLKQFDVAPESCYSLQNPVNPETPFLRPNMLYNLLLHAAKNSKFFDTFRIFDIGKVWTKGKTPNASSPFARESVQEESHLGILLYTKTIASWEDDPFLEAKSLLKELLLTLHISGNISFELSTLSAFHPKKQATISLGTHTIGTIASVHPLILKEHKIPESAGVVYVDLHLPTILSLLEKNDSAPSSYETLQDQILWRDLCFVVENTSSFTPVLDAIKTLPEIAGLEVFDLYQGTNLGEGKKSVSIKIKIVGDGSLTTEGINAIMDKAIAAAEKTGGELRK